MAETWGITPEGFYCPTFSEVLSDLETRERANIDPDLDLSAETFLGQHNGIASRARALVWEALRVAYYAFDADSAEGVLFENLAKLSGTGLNPATYSLVSLTCVFSAEETLEPDTHFIAVEEREDVRFTPFETATYAAGSHAILFRSEFTGPVAAAAGTVTVLSAVPVGLVSATNSLDATPGKNAETIEELRARRDEDIAITGGSTEDAIEADVRQAGRDELGIDLYVLVISNRTPATVDGIPPHAYETVVYSGAALTTEQKNTIAKAILDSGPDGIQFFGQTSGVATDASGDVVTVGMTESEEVGIWIVAEIVAEDDTDLVALKQAWAQALNERFQNGQEVVALYAKAWPLGFEGVSKVTSFAIGTSASPTDEDDIPITIRQIPRFDTSRIEVTNP